jgi:hypothetical protein
VKDHVCECCRIAAVFDQAGDFVLAWRDIMPGSMRDHAFVRMTRDGQCLTPRRLTRDGWVIDALRAPRAGDSVPQRRSPDAGGHAPRAARILVFCGHGSSAPAGLMQ